MSTVESELIESRDGRRDEASGRRGGDTSHAPHAGPVGTTPARIDGVVTGTLIGFRDEGQTPLVLYPGQPGSAANAAATIIDLHGAHVGRQVALMFESGDPRRPMIMGLLRNPPHAWPLAGQPVEVDSDGDRLVVSAREQLVLRCGKASITLTKAGKVLIQGAYVSNRSSGVIRIKGGSVQIN
jgi:hypothetical protein